MTPDAHPTAETLPPYAPVLIRLLQGIVYHDDQDTWDLLLRHQPEIRAYFKTIGGVLYLREADGYAFLRQDDTEATEHLPRLVRRQALNYPTTLLCVLLRERLLQHDTSAIDSPRLVVTREDLHEAMRPFFREHADETRYLRRIDSAISRVRTMGFLTPLQGTREELFEVRRILKDHLTADRLAEIKHALETHADDDDASDD